MPLWKDKHFVDDAFQVVPDDAPLPETGAIVSLKRWRDEREALAGRNAPLGVMLPPDAVWDDIIADLPRFPVVAVAIPKLFDGRAFSIARLLRERDGYKGEIRAVGIFTIDQMPLMRRVGIDAFQVEDERTSRQLERGVWPEVKEYYQPTEAGPQVPAGTRPWARKGVN